MVTVSLALLTLGLTACAIVLPVSAGAPTSAYYLHTGFVMDHTPAGTGHKTTIDLSPGMSLTWTSTDVYPAGDVIPAGTYTFTADWQKDAKARASVTFTVGYGTSCGSFANLVSWTSDVNAPPKPTTTGATTTHATDLPSGGPYHICFRIHVNSITCNGNKCPFAIVFDTSRFQAILNLPAKYRAVVILRHMQDRTYEEIAAILELPLNTVRTHLFRARELLRRRLYEPEH